MRSPREILFRLRQESANAILALIRPAVSIERPAPLEHLPRPESAAALCGPAYAAEVETLASAVLAGNYELLGYHVHLGRDLHWRRDFIHGQESAPRYLRLVPYLDATRVGDHKIIWELNRHQHFVLLAQAALVTGRSEFI